MIATKHGSIRVTDAPGVDFHHERLERHRTTGRRGFKGMAERRRLCTRWYGKAVDREQAKIAPLPGTVDLSDDDAGRRVGRPVRALRRVLPAGNEEGQ